MQRTRWGVLPLVAAALALATAALYLGLILAEPDRPAAWFLGAVLLGAAAAVYGAHPASAHRRAALLLAGLDLAVMGVLALLSVGWPLVVAGLLCLVAAARSRRARPISPS